MTTIDAPRAKVLLAGADDRCMLATARSLTRNGIPVVALGLDLDRRSTMGSSRYLRSRIAGPAPNVRLEPERYVEFVLQVARRTEVELVFPLMDASLYACDLYRDAIESETRLAAAPSPAVRNVLDKKANLETARRLGIPCPDQFELQSLDQIPDLIAELGFPIVLKHPHKPRGGLGDAFDFRWLVAHNEPELRDYLSRLCAHGEFPVVQRQVTGTVENVCCFAVDGAIVAALQYRSLRRLSGSSVYRRIVPLAPELKGYAEAMLGALQWQGVAHVAFFVRETDGDVRYMETNGRLWASTAGSVAAGFDFPTWTYDYFVSGRTPRPPQSAEVGRESRWHYGDLEALIGFLREGDGSGGSQRTRARAVADYLSGFHPRVDSDVFTLDDPLPELLAHYYGLRGKAARVWRKAVR